VGRLLKLYVVLEGGNLLTVPATISVIHATVLLSNYSISDFDIVKGKAIPLQALTGPEGSRRLRLPDFKTIGI
jgi:hypothetical protein